MSSSQLAPRSLLYKAKARSVSFVFMVSRFNSFSANAEFALLAR
jgi:hypothetical protein